MDPRVFIYADESCLGNQFTDRANPGGAGGLVEFWRGDHWLRRDYWLSEADTTNNRMALRSAIDGLAGLSRRCRVVFTSDSQYLVRGMNEWLSGWIARGWKRKGGPVENEALWRQLADAAARHDVSWRWVRGHAGHPQNEYANHLATSAAKHMTTSHGFVDSGFLEWLEQQREKYQRYDDDFEARPPAEAG
jgi:ribonuclease HI